MARLLKRIAVLLVAGAILFSLALYFLYFRRPPLPAVPAHPRVEPAISSVPNLFACWIETGSTFTDFSFASTAGSLLVRHPAGDLLIDTGNSSHFEEEVASLPFRTRFKLNQLAGKLDPPVPLPGLLRLVGADPAKLRWVILSHTHLDHAGGLMDLPPTPVLLTAEELQFANDPKIQSQGFVIPAHARKFTDPKFPALQFEAKPYETFDESADLYKDGSVVVVPLRGHTPGSVGIFVNLAPDRRFFYVGDAVDDERGFQERVGKSLILEDSDDDQARADQIVGRLYELHALLPSLAIIPAHGRSAYGKFFPGGPLSCVSGR